MSNAFAIFRRDLMRLLRVPAAWVILFGLIFLPPLYAWFNIIGFWNPYGNTHGIHVAVANEDQGANNDVMGRIELGDQIVSQLKTDNTLGWRFVSQPEAMRQVYSGDSYAAIIIPKDFSRQVSGITTGTATKPATATSTGPESQSATGTTSGTSSRPTLEYYVNEKKNGIATKITDTGANTVDRQVNDAFVSAVSKAITSATNNAAGAINAQTDSTTNQTLRDLRTAKQDITDIRAVIAHLRATLAAAPQQTQSARAALQSADSAGKQAGSSLQNASKLIGETQNTVGGLLASSSTSLDQGSALLAQASGQTNLTVSSLAAQLTQANGKVATALDTATALNTSNAQLIADLKQLQQDSGVQGTDGIIAKLQEQNTALSNSINGLSQLNTDTGNTVTDTANSSKALNSATQATLNDFGKAHGSLVSGTLPNLNNSLTSLASSANDLGAGLSTQGALIAQANVVLNQLDQAISTADSSLADTDAGLGGLSTRLDTLIVDLGTLDSSNLLADVLGDAGLGGANGTTGANALGPNGQLDAGAIASFMLSPTLLNTQIVYPVNSYGSGMAPLFTSLSLWVGAFMLVLLIKLEVDDEGLGARKPTLNQRYWGRWMLLALVAAMQGLVTAIGNLIIGVQSVNDFAFVVTSLITSLVYVSIAYALSVSFMHIGKVLWIVLVMVQIPGSSGMYPIELLPGFFRAMSPFLPFTHAVNAQRETIGGFYDGHWAADIFRLLLFAVAAFLLGLVARPHLITLNRLAAKEIAQSDMIVSEPVMSHGREYRLSQAIGVLADKTEYRAMIERRAARFAELYPRLRHGALVAGLVIPLVLAVTFSLTTGTKLVALAAWLIYLLLIVQFLMAIELMRDSLERQLRLGTLSDERVRGIVREYAASRWHYGTHARGDDTSASAGADAGAGLVSGIAGAAVLISGAADEADGVGEADGGGNGSDTSDIEQTQQLPALHDAAPSNDDGHPAKRDTNTAKPIHDPTHEERGHTA
ncbi:YhgE/Pip domain-containing protein [Bifidobacterium tibiigranuli]|jgi:putative membrane protein|uniref:YhgE/Pip domain-containing protein n=1 Tax=Bifidobacterium tibiigranuli TaxID=2172043 RepID=UPI0026EB18EF|nr:YhgE/Pip domain-containing protein [Bifidobacterium tibiigranuli]MCI2184745.1 YhgE/Pip domain-containing protein [Bifidobacterium tibiigranuli]MCI2204568.1 YhgE/Pip domain-containing protein [Bifidobacterium tibiigranuli]